MLAPKRRKSSLIEHIEVHDLDEARLSELGDALREEYESVKDEPIPDRLRKLVEALRALDAKTDTND